MPPAGGNAACAPSCSTGTRTTSGFHRLGLGRTMRANCAVDEAAIQRAFRQAEQLAQLGEAGHFCRVQQRLQAFGSGVRVEAHGFFLGGAGYGWDCFWAVIPVVLNCHFHTTSYLKGITREQSFRFI